MPEIELQPDRPLRRIGFFILLFAAAASIMGLVEFSQEPTARYGWLPYLGSTVLLMAAAYILIPYKKTEKQLEPYTLIILVIGILILALATFMRFFRFDSMPLGTWNDEAYIGMIARNILSDPAYRPFFVGGYDHPLHFFALIALAFKFFGDGTLSIRLVTVLFGLGTVILSFFAGREISGNRLGLIFAFLFAISRWHVTFSRFGVYTNAMPFFELLTIWLILRARRTMQVHDFLWAGLAFGYGLNFYIGIRLFIPVVLLYLGFWVIDTLRRKTAPESTVKSSWPVLLSGLVALFLAAWFAVAPLAQYAMTHPNDFWGRSSAVSIFSHRDQSNLALALYSNTVKHLLMFNYQGDPNGRHNLSAEPMLDPVTGILFIVGFVLICIGFRNSTYSLFLMLFAFNLLGGILTVDFEAPQSNRAFGSISAAIFFAAMGFEMYWRELDKSRLSISVRRLVLSLTILCFGGYIIYYNANTYFVRQANSDRTWDEFNGTQSMAAKRMVEADPAHTIIYSSVYLHDHEIIRFLDPQITDSRGIIPPIGLPVRELGDKPVAIFVDGNNSWIVEEALKFYPNAQFHLDSTPSGAPALYSVLISPQDIQRLQGVTFSYWAGDNPQGNPNLVRDEKSIQTSWASQPPIAAPFVAQLESTLYAPQYGNYDLILHAPADASLWLDGELILDGAGEQHVTRQLAQGDHVLKIQAHSGNDPLDLQWRIPDANGVLSGDPTPIPSNSLYLPDLVPVRGLLGNYYKGDSWSHPQAFSRIDPFLDMYIHITPLDRPYTVDWSGQIEIPASGTWSFGLWINGSAQVFIDDKLVVDAAEPAEDIEGTADLKAGRHSIHIRFLDNLGGSRIHLYWTAPDGQREIVPSSALFPFP